MWLLFILIAVVAEVSSCILSKRLVVADRVAGYLKARIVIGILGGVAWILLTLGRMGESKLLPWQILAENPLIALGATCTVFSELFYLLAMGYVGVSIVEVVASSSGVLVFLLMLFAHCFAGRFSSMTGMLTPLPLTLIIVILAGVILLPYADYLATRAGNLQQSVVLSWRKWQKCMLAGCCILGVALLGDAIDTVLTSLVFAENTIGYLDFLITALFCSTLWNCLLYVFLCRKEKRIWNPFQFSHRLLWLNGFAYLICIAFYLCANKMKPVETPLFWQCYPVFPLIAASVILKERYSWLQYLCMGCILLASIAFGFLQLGGYS